eukprot:8565626-Pyramimonas_sp.AAC.1
MDISAAASSLVGPAIRSSLLGKPRLVAFHMGDAEVSGETTEVLHLVPDGLPNIRVRPPWATCVLGPPSQALYNAYIICMDMYREYAYLENFQNRV